MFNLSLLLLIILVVVMIILLNRSHNKIKSVTSSMNKMTRKLQDQISETEARQSHISAILGNMTEGIIAVDSARRVLVANPSAERMFGIHEKKVLHTGLIEAVKNPLIDDLAAEAIRSRTIMKKEIELIRPEEKILNVIAIGTVESADEICGLLVFYDVTEIRKLENTRKEIIDDLSHQLRTPLTSIKGFAETLSSGVVTDPQKSKDYLIRIEESANRLTRLIDDLLKLT